MHDAKLRDRMGKDTLNGFGKPFEVVRTGNENILHASCFQICEDRQPEGGVLTP